ncbi:MAG: HD domain-containing protein [Chitinophagales bacterium]
METWQREELPVGMYYHSIHHVLDVLHVAQKLCAMEGVDAADTELVSVAALYHDSGYIFSPIRHEERGCALAKETLPEFGYNPVEIEKICHMILATRLPQSPQNLLEQILCDADMDYLGREDYDIIAQMLYREWHALGGPGSLDNWDQQQERFLQAHTYFTDSAKNLREEGKNAHLQKILERMKNER